MFTNVAIVAQPGPELNEIRKSLRNPVLYTVREFLSIEGVNQGLTNYPFDVLVMRLNQFGLPHVSLVSKVRARFPRAGLITLSPEISPQARYQIRELPGHKLLQDPLEIADLTNVIDKLVHRDGSPNRLHPRVARQGDCELVDGKGVKIPATFLDFAQLGARLVAHPRSPLKRGGNFQLHYPSTTEPGRTQRIASKIIWEHVSSGMVDTIMKGPEQTLGLRFIAAV